jgi:F-type H+-transporting ATPase subunit delta
MTNLPENYARVLFDLNIGSEQVQEARELLVGSDELREALISPIVTKADKRKVIDRLFPEAMRNFIKVMSDNGDLGIAEDMFGAYDALIRERDGVVYATFAYVTAPDEAQVEKLKSKIAKDHGKQKVELHLVEDRSLIGGFVLTVEDRVLDRSVKTSITRLRRHFAER